MTGAVMALAAGGASGAGGGAVPSPTPVWTTITGTFIGSSNTQTISGISGPISLTASVTGGAPLYYVQNGGGPVAYTGAFPVNPGDTLAWMIMAPGSGTVTVTNVSDSDATLATIPYGVYSAPYV
jgi:hypothetical protein